MKELLGIGRTKPVHKLLHPPAKKPYVAPDTIMPATVCLATSENENRERCRREGHQP